MAKKKILSASPLDTALIVIVILWVVFIIDLLLPVVSVKFSKFSGLVSPEFNS